VNEERKWLLTACIMGFVLGALIGNGIVIAFGSSSEGIVFVSHELARRLGETPALIVQTILSGIVGIIGFVSTKVYHSERFSILAATLIHMAISMTALIIVGRYLEWFGDSLQELLMFLIIPAAMYAMIWFSVYMSYRAEIRRINESLERRRSGKE